MMSGSRNDIHGKHSFRLSSNLILVREPPMSLGEAPQQKANILKGPPNGIILGLHSGSGWFFASNG